MAEKVMVQDSVHICPRCTGGMRKLITDTDMLFICDHCHVSLKIVGKGQSERELECEIVE